MPTPDRIVAALERLDPEDRAHLELSYRRGFSESEVADLLGVEPAAVGGLRDDAVSELADELGESAEDTRAELARMDEDDWAGRAEPDAGAEPEAGAEPQADERTRRLRLADAASDAPAATPIVAGASRSRRRPLLLLAFAAVVVLALIVALTSGGGDETKPSGQSRAQDKRQGKTGGGSTQPEVATPPASTPARRMQRLNGTYGHGTARIVKGDGGRPILRLRVSGFLKPTGGGYAVWLLTPPDDARRLYVTTRTSISRDIPLPRDYGDFQLVEVARAVPALSSPHSSFSLLRVRVSALGGG
jgi:hypothetical protein